MESAILVINDEKKFCYDIWQYKNTFTEEEWKSTIRNFADIIQDAYKYLSEEREKGDVYPDDKLYQVGDVANMLYSIGLRKRG